MELDKQDERIYGLLEKAPKIDSFNGRSYQFCVASDIIRLPLLNIIGGIYLDMDTKITGEIGEIDT